MAKGLKLKVRTFGVLTSTFVESTGEKWIGGLFALISLILNRVDINSFCFILNQIISCHGFIFENLFQGIKIYLKRK